MRCNINKTIALLLILLASEVAAFGRPRSHKNNRKSVKVKNECEPRASSSVQNFSTEDNEIDSIRSDIDPYGNCALVKFGVVQKIPYQSPTSGSSTIDVNFSSACVRCGICLAVVERMNQTLSEEHDILPSNQWLDDEEIDNFLRAICDYGFRHYNLREFDGERYIGDRLAGATLVANTADGHWETNLKQKCHDILDDVGTQKLYKYWQEWCNGAAIDLDEILCRSDSSSLRDCRSISGEARKPDPCQIFYHAGIKVNAKLSCT